MATSTIIYSSPITITMDLSSLTTSPTWIGGAESTEVNNTSNKYIDALVEGTVVGGSTVPTVGQSINIHVWGSDVAASTTNIDSLDGTSSVETITLTLRDGLRIGASLQVVTGSGSLTYYCMPFSVARLFDGILPPYWGLFVAHNHTGSLGVSNSNLFTYTGIKYDMT